VLRHYLAGRERQPLTLLGYSFGADVLPSIVNRLPADLRDRISHLVLIGLGHDATWEIRVTEWLPGLAPVGEPLAPEIARLPELPILCLYGEDERSLCPALSANRATGFCIGSGHHLGGDYDAIADRILAFIRVPTAP
jgi:type IV secretory pathway VirJ component